MGKMSQNKGTKSLYILTYQASPRNISAKSLQTPGLYLSVLSELLPIQEEKNTEMRRAENNKCERWAADQINERIEDCTTYYHTQKYWLFYRVLFDCLGTSIQVGLMHMDHPVLMILPTYLKVQCVVVLFSFSLEYIYWWYAFFERKQYFVSNWFHGWLNTYYNYTSIILHEKSFVGLLSTVNINFLPLEWTFY